MTTIGKSTESLGEIQQCSCNEVSNFVLPALATLAVTCPYEQICASFVVQVPARAVFPAAVSHVMWRETAKFTTTVGVPMPSSTEPCPPLEREEDGEREGPLGMPGKGQVYHIPVSL